MGAVLALWSAVVQAEVVDQTEDLFVTRAAAETSATPMESWVALITPSKWWNAAHSWSGDSANMTLTPQGGGCFCERLPADPEGSKAGLAGSVEHMTVLLALPEQVLRMRGGLGPLQSEPVDGVLTITLKPVEGGTRILWEYVVGGAMRYELPMISKAVDGVMAEQLSRLVDHLGPLGSAESLPDTDEAVGEDDTPEAADSPSVDEAFEDLKED